MSRKLLALAVTAAVFAACGGMSSASGGGSAAGGGSSAAGGGSSAAGGGSSSSISFAECFERCTGYAEDRCGASSDRAAAICSDLCDRSPNDSQVRCLEALSCTSDPERCFPTASGGGSGAGGGSSSAGGGSSSAGGGSSSAGGGSSSAGGGSGGNPCAIPKENLKVSTFPYLSTSPRTIVKLPGFPNPPCSRSGSGGNYAGYSTASAHAVLEAGAKPYETTMLASLRILRFSLKQRDFTASERSSLVSKTGIPEKFFMNSETLRSVSDVKPKLVNVTLPAGVEVSWFLPTSFSSEGYVDFSSTTNYAGVDSMLQAMAASNARIELTVGYFSSISGTPNTTYTLKLRPSFEVVNITIP